MNPKSYTKVIFVFFLLIVSSSIGFLLIKKYSEENPSSARTRVVIQDKRNQVQDSQLGVFVRDYFGFDIDMNEDEYAKLGITCSKTNLPSTPLEDNVPGKVFCNGSTNGIGLWVGWKREEYTKMTYLGDVAARILSFIPDSVPGQYTCTEDTNFNWYAKMPATISDCAVTSDSKTYYYSVVFFDPNKIHGVGNTVTIFSSTYNEKLRTDILVKIRAFAERVRYLEIAKKKNKQVSLLFVTPAFASTGSASTGGFGSGNSEAQSGGYGNTGTSQNSQGNNPSGVEGGQNSNNNSNNSGPQGDSGGGNGPDPWTPTCSNGASDYPVCTPVCIPNGSCSATPPACGNNTTYGVDNCGASCSVTSACCDTYGQTCTVNSPSNVCGDYFADSRGTYTCAGTCTANSLSAPILPYTDLSCTVRRGYDTLASACNGTCSCSGVRKYDTSTNTCVNSPSALSLTINGSSTGPVYIPYGASQNVSFAWGVTSTGGTVCHASGAGFPGLGSGFSLSSMAPTSLNTARRDASIANVSLLPPNTLGTQTETSNPVLPTSGNIALSGSGTATQVYSDDYSIRCENVAGSLTQTIHVSVVCPTPVTYSNWSACTKSCGSGTRTRRDTNCFGTEVTEACNTEPCAASSWREVAP